MSSYDIINQSDSNDYKSLYYLESRNQSLEIFLHKKNNKRILLF